MVQKWLDKGFTEKEILLMWNQGHRGACSSGTNKHGVEYNSCNYVIKGLKYLTYGN